MSKSTKFLLSAACILLLAGLSLGFYFSGRQVKSEAEENREKPASVSDDTSFLTSANTKKDIVEKAEDEYILNDISNILLIGVDNNTAAGMDKYGNADGIMLLTVNNKAKQVTLTSFMRDTRIRQPNDYEKKISEIYKVAGAKLLIEAMEQNFGVYIDNYIVVNFLNVIDIVDALGGLDIELSVDEINAMREKLINLSKLSDTDYESNAISPEQAGLLHLNGIQTTAYLRVRPSSTGNDSGRTVRARNVVTMIVARLMAMSTGEKAGFADKFLPCIETDMSEADILSFSMNTSKFVDYELFSAKIPLDGTYTDSNDGNYYVIPDFEVNNKYLYESIYEGKH